MDLVHFALGLAVVLFICLVLRELYEEGVIVLHCVSDRLQERHNKAKVLFAQCIINMNYYQATAAGYTGCNRPQIMHIGTYRTNCARARRLVLLRARLGWRIALLRMFGL